MATDIDKIKDTLDIVSVIGEYVPTLKKSGQNYFGLCPFHSEKSPSFSVNPDLGIFKCFGCGEGGDVLTFIQKIEGLEFREALQFAASKAGVKLSDYDSPAHKEKRDFRERAKEAHKLTADYYNFILVKHKLGEKALEYISKERKIPLRLIEKFKLGYAPNGYHNLQTFLIKKGFNIKELVDFGLLVNKNNRIYDKFRDRIIHPIRNSRGDVIAFSGRIINKNSKAPKYLNSPETEIYYKSKELYGIWEAKESLRKRKFAIVVEGNLDVVSSHKVDVENIVCPLGTSLTVLQLKLLKRYVDKVYFAFDNDKAGQNALLKSFSLAEKLNIPALAINLGSEVGDVDDLVRLHPDEWSSKVENALPIPEYIMEIFRHNYEMSNADEIDSFLKLVLPYLTQVQSQIKLDYYLQKLSKITGITLDTLIKEYTKTEKKELSLSVQKSKIKKSPDPNKREDHEDKEEKINISTSFRNLLIHLYTWRELLAEKKETYIKIMENFMDKRELNLVSSAMSLESSDKKSKNILAKVLADATFTVETNIKSRDALREIIKLSKSYLRSKYQEDFRKLKIKINNAETEIEKDNILEEMSEITKKLGSIQLSSLNGIK